MENPSPPQTPKSEMIEDLEAQSLTTFHCLNTDCAQKQHNDSRTIKDLKFLIGDREKELQREKDIIEELKTVNSTIEKESTRFQDEADAKQAHVNNLNKHLSEVVTAFEQLKVLLDTTTAEKQSFEEESANKLQQAITTNQKEIDELKKKASSEKARGDTYKKLGLDDKVARQKLEETIKLLQTQIDQLKKQGATCDDSAIVQVNAETARQMDELTAALDKERTFSQQCLEETAQYKAAGERLLQDVEYPYFRFSEGASADIVKVRRLLSIIQDEEVYLAGRLKQAVETYMDTAAQVNQPLENINNGWNDDQFPEDTREPRTFHSTTMSPSPNASQLNIQASEAPTSMRKKHVTFEDDVRGRRRRGASSLVWTRIEPSIMDRNGLSDEPLTKRVRYD